MADLLSSVFQRKHDPSLSLAMTVSSHLAISQLIAFWPFSGWNGSGDTLDISGNALHLVIAAGTPGISTIGLWPYRSFDGAADYMQQTNSIFRTTGSVTWGCWVKFDDATPAATEIIMGISGNTTAAQTGYRIQRQTTGEIRVVVSDGAVTDTVSGASITDNTLWHHIAGRWNATSTTITVWVDGVYNSKVSATVAALNAPAINFTAGAAIGSNYTDGNLSMMWVARRALDRRIIQNLYQRGRAAVGR
jgi:hypothetical protein